MMICCSVGSVTQVGRFRSRGPSSMSPHLMADHLRYTLRGIAHIRSFAWGANGDCGHSTGVAFSMVQLGLTLQDVATALDLEEGLEFLGDLTQNRVSHNNHSKEM